MHISTDPLHPNENFEQTLDLLGLKAYTQIHSRLLKNRNGFYVDCIIINLIDDKRVKVKFNNGTKKIVQKKDLIECNFNLVNKPWRCDHITMSRFFDTHNKLQKQLKDKEKKNRKLQNKIITLKGVIASLRKQQEEK